jgi:hypothetical protein
VSSKYEQSTNTLIGINKILSFNNNKLKLSFTLQTSPIHNKALMASVGAKILVQRSQVNFFFFFLMNEKND